MSAEQQDDVTKPLAKIADGNGAHNTILVAPSILARMTSRLAG